MKELELTDGYLIMTLTNLVHEFHSHPEKYDVAPESGFSVLLEGYGTVTFAPKSEVVPEPAPVVEPQPGATK